MVKFKQIKYDDHQIKEFVHKVEHKDKKEILSTEEMMGIAFAVLRIYVLSLVGINLSIFAVLAILLYKDYDIYLDLIHIVPDIALPI